MWVLSSKLLLLWTTGLHKQGPLSAVVSQFASHHVSASLLSPGDGGIKPVAKSRRRTSGTSTDQRKNGGSDGWQRPERSARSETWKGESPEWPRREGDSRVSSELRRLSLDDFPAEKAKMAGQKSTAHAREAPYEVLFGVAPCLLALTQGRRRARKLFVKDGVASHRAAVLEVCEEAHRRGVQVQRISKKELDRMSSGRLHQGVCLQASPLAYLAEDRDPPAPTGRDPPLWLVLERVQDPMNLGAILRSAYFLGVDRVASSLRHSCPLSPVVSKASSGVMEVIGVYGYESLQDMLKVKVARGWQVVGSVGAGAEEPPIPVTSCLDFRMTKPTVLLMGGEGEGLSRELLSLCQTLLTIPAGRELFPGVESLNVSVASGILLHALLSSRGSAGR
ncbi:rRNA methyltransferase 1, mitochondrial [Pungitius pungitius]|uniref:rRNA methyltransferase 1, mitochondrial n=1 Tax=Pungitius pungitius TaxID=134920 RepID=UPI002E10E358